MKKFLCLLICLPLAVGFTVSKAAKPKQSSAAVSKSTKGKSTGKKATAKELVAAAKKALAVMVKNARADKQLDSKTAKNKPFYDSVKKISKQLDRAEKGLAGKSNDFFDAISDARSAEEQMKIDWQLTGSKNKKVIDDGKKLGHALAVLRTDYSKEAARKKKGGELTAKEKAQFEKIKAQQKDLIAKIDKLKAKAGKDKALMHGLAEMEKNAQKVVSSPMTVNAFVATLYLVDEIKGQLYGYDYYIDKSWRSDWITVDTYVTTWDTTYAEFVAEESYEWSSVEVATELNASEDIDVSESISAEEINSEESYVENTSFDMSDAEEEQVAEAEDTDAEVEADESADNDSMEDATDDEGEGFDGGDEDDGGGDEDGGADDDGGDDGGDDGD